MSEADSELQLVPGRDCGGCVMCCKVFPIAETGKPDFGLCANARVGAGCAAHDDRPDVCGEFFCLWRLDAGLGEEWRPDIAGFVLHETGPWTLLVSCDADNPEAWRREPYESRIRAWAEEAQRRQMLIGARAGQRTTLLLRDREVELNG